MKRLYCKYCGNEIDNNAMFCSKCGKQIRKSTTGQSGENENRFWYYIDNGIKCGPFNSAEIIEAIKDGEILSSTLVWTEGFSTWIPAQNTELNEYLVKVVPAISPESISDKWVWALATVPLLANIILFEIGLREPILTIIVIVLNCVFLFFDINYLRKVYSDPGKWVYLGIILVPVYLFIRAAKTNKKYAYGIVWCVMFILSILPIW